MIKKEKIGWIIALLFIGFSGGIITGTVVDTDQVYHTTIKKIRQKQSPDGSIVVDIKPSADTTKSKKEVRREERDVKKEARKLKRAQKKQTGTSYYSPKYLYYEKVTFALLINGDYSVGIIRADC